MCGRFTLTVSAKDELQQAFPHFHIPNDLPPSYNIAPSQPIPTLTGEDDRLDFHRWGLVPSWANEKFCFPNIQLDQCPGERGFFVSAAEKPSFRNSFRRRRCLIPADGFYEWKQPGKDRPKRPYYIHKRDRSPFTLGGLWEIWQPPDGGQLRSACIITTPPNTLVEPIHNRMPLILDPEDYAGWLDPEVQDPDKIQEWIKPYSGNDLETHPVSTYVNNPRHNSPQCIKPLEQ